MIAKHIELLRLGGGRLGLPSETNCLDEPHNFTVVAKWYLLLYIGPESKLKFEPNKIPVVDHSWI